MKKDLMKKDGFSLAEIIVVFIVMTGIILLTGRFVFSDRQKQYDAKFSKLSKSITANIDKDLIRKVGFDYGDYYASTGVNTDFQTAVKNNLNQKECTIGNCWGKIKEFNIDGDGYKLDGANWKYYRLNDNSVMAVNTSTPEIVVDVNGPKGPNIAGQDVRAYNYPNKQACEISEIGTKDPKYTYEYKNSICKWIISGCTDTNRHLVDMDCVCNNENQYSGAAFQFDKSTCLWSCSYVRTAQGWMDISGKTRVGLIAAPDLNNGCQYKYGCTSYEEAGYNATLHSYASQSNARVLEKKVQGTPANDCKNGYAYSCKSTIDANRDDTIGGYGRVNTEITKPTPSNNCTSTYTYTCKDTTVEGKDNNIVGAGDKVTSAFSRVAIDIEKPEPKNNCTKKYSYKCTTSINTGKNETLAKNERLKEILVQKADYLNNCENKYSYECKTTKDVNKNDVIGANSRVATTITPATVENNCENVYGYSCKSTEEIKVDYDEKIAEFLKSKTPRIKEEKTKIQKAAPDNNCENKTKYKYTCIDSKIVTAKTGYNETLHKYAVQKNPRVQENKQTVQKAEPKNNCENKVSYTYVCKITMDINRNAALLKNSRVAEKIVQYATPTNNCVAKYDYSCKTTVDSGYNTTLHGYAVQKNTRVQETKLQSATPANNCENKYTYKCKSTVNSGYDATLHKYATQKNPRVKEVIVKATPTNNCVNTYSYSCASTLDADKNAALLKNDRIAEKIVQYAAPTNNCITKYSYSCKTTVDTGYSKKLHDFSVQKGTRVQERKTQTASVANKCENKYTYSCKSYKTSGYDAKLNKYAYLKSGRRVKEEKINATPDNNCEYIYKYSCSTTVNTGYNVKYSELSKQKDSRVKEVLTQTAAPANNCENRYKYECKSTINEGYNKTYSERATQDAIKKGSRIRETKTVATVANNCINTYKYNCVNTSTEGYNKTYSAYAKQKDPKVREDIIKANLDNNCLNTYSYVCIKKSKSGYNETYHGYAVQKSPIILKETIKNVATISNNCTDYYNYDCLTGTANSTFDKPKHDLSARIKESQKTKSDKSKPCMYVYECKKGTANNSYNKTKHSNTNIKESFSELTDKEPCLYAYECKTGNNNSTYDNKKLRKLYGSDFEKYAKETLKPVTDKDKACKYTYSCLTGTANSTFDKPKHDLSARIKEEQKDISDKKKPCKYIYTCKTGKDNDSFDAIKSALSTVKETLSGVNDEPPCKYTYECKTGKANPTYDDKLHKEAAKANPKVRETLPTMENKCQYKYVNIVCKKKPVGYNETYHSYSVQANARVQEDIKMDKNGCIEYTYKCASTITNVQVRGGHFKEYYTQYASVSNNCINILVRDPLILDLKGDGIKLTSLEDGVYFDLDADGTIDKTSWTAKQDEFDDAFLVLDKNGNGEIDNGSELFGDQNGSENGIYELAKYDDNNDGKITEKDKAYTQLQLWADMNKNGKADAGELKSLSDLNIVELSTSQKIVYGDDGKALKDEHGNDVSIRGWFTQRVERFVDGVKTFWDKMGEMIDAFFQMISGGGEE